MDDPWIKRLAALRQAISGQEGLTEAAKVSALTAIDRIEELHRESGTLLEGVQGYSGFWEDADASLDALPAALKDGAEAVHGWSRDILERLRGVVQRQIDYGNDFEQVIGKPYERRIAGDLQSVATARTADRLEIKSEAILDELETSAEVARLSSGSVAGSNLATYFKDYAEEQKKRADYFRVATLVLISATTLAAFALSAIPSSGWTAFAARISFVAAVAALAAYCGRQSTLHRRLADWARTLQVQLLSLSAFIEPISGPDARDQVYSAFARRVLGAPPMNMKEDSDGNAQLSMPQVLELLTAYVKKL